MTDEKTTDTTAPKQAADPARIGLPQKPVAPAPTVAKATEPKKPSTGERIAAIEKRWGKKFEEVLIDIHDHIYGATPPAAAPAEKLA